MTISDCGVIVSGTIDSKSRKRRSCSRLCTKVLVMSLLRSHFSGPQAIFSDESHPLFRVIRGQVEEFPYRSTNLGVEVSLSDTTSSLFNSTFAAFINPKPRQWIIFIEPYGVALRNIDHLFPRELEGPYAPPRVDFLWARVHDDPRSGPRDLAAPGFWAVRGEHAEMVLDRLKAAWEAEPGATEADETRIWSQVVRDLPLRKRAFERGEVLCPPVGSIDWKALCSAAFVTVPHWPEPERWKFLQSLYFGTYFADETGMLVNLFDP